MKQTSIHSLTAILFITLALVDGFGQQRVDTVELRGETRVRDYYRSNPGMSTLSLLEFANNVAEEHGFEFRFSPEKHKAVTSGGRKFADYAVQKLNGAKINLRGPEPKDHPCGIAASLPVMRVTKDQITIRSTKGPVVLRLPKNFIVDEVALVDDSLKKTIRSWVVPIDSVPVGISPDGQRLYVNSGMDEFVIRIDEQGNYRYFLANYPAIISDAVDLTDFPKEKGNDYLGYRRFSSGDRYRYTVKFSHPCT